MDRILLQIPHKMLELGLIKNYEVDLVIYGLELFLIKISHYCGIFILAYLIAEIKGLLIMTIFITPYLYLRSKTGGYHSKTRVGCFIISILITLFMLYFNAFYDKTMMILFGIIASIYIYLQSPIENENVPLTRDECLGLRKKIKRFLIIMYIVNYYLIVYNFEKYAYLLIMAVIFDSFLMLIQNIINKYSIRR